MKDMTQLITTAKKPKSWIIKDLILRGDQIMISAAPKSGKSLLASQLALCAATGQQFLRWLVPQPVRVLYFNLEVNEEIFAERLQMQAALDPTQIVAGQMMIESGVKAFDIKKAQSRDQIANQIKTAKADLVVFDVLARTHTAQENDNSEMKDVLLQLRKVCGNAASVVIHHSRKAPQGMGNANLGASSMRGASAVHGEVDLAMTLVKDTDANLHSLKFSARNIREPDEMFLKLCDNTLLFSETAKPISPMVSVIEYAFSMSPKVSSTTIKRELAKALNIEERQAQRHLARAVKDGLISGPVKEATSPPASASCSRAVARLAPAESRGARPVTIRGRCPQWHRAHGCAAVLRRPRCWGSSCWPGRCPTTAGVRAPSRPPPPDARHTSLPSPIGVSLQGTLETAQVFLRMRAAPVG